MAAYVAEENIEIYRVEPATATSTLLMTVNLPHEGFHTEGDIV